MLLFCLWDSFFSRNSPEARKVGGKYIGVTIFLDLLIAPKDQFKFKLRYLVDNNIVSSFKYFFAGYLREPEISPLQLCVENVHRTLQRSVNAWYR